MNTAPFEILTGVGRLYIAPIGTAFPIVTAVPASPWRDLGVTQDGVTVTMDQEIEQIFVDQEIGPVKEGRTTETITVATNLAEATLENLADILGQTITTVAAGIGIAGTKAVTLYRGPQIKAYAMLFRGVSAYGDFPAQYQFPRGYFAGALEMEDTKDGNRQYPIEFQSTINLDGTTDADKYGILIMQTTAPTA